MNIPRTAVTSSNIKSIGYSPTTKTLAIEFPSGVYLYADVPPQAHADLMAAKSIGGHFASNIRGKYQHAREGEKK